MTTQEILQLLDEKRVLTAPAAVAWDEVQRQQNRLNKAAKRLNGPITVTLALNLLFAFTIFLLEQSHLMHGFLLMLGLMGGLIAIKYFVFVAPAKQALANAQALYNQEISQPAYQQEMQGFPQKFYNYHDLFRLYNLIAEGRASTLPEAYNLLEMQQFQETQVNLQEEANALQADIARSSRVSAVANVVTAYNTYRIHKDM